MSRNIPTWAMQAAAPADREAAQRAHRLGTMQMKWPDRKAIRAWAKKQGWMMPWFGFEEAFITKMFANDANFALALNESGIEMHIPKRNHVLSLAKLKELDALYEERSSSGRPVSWGVLVEELREIRRAVEAGVRVQVEGTETVLRSWQGFYDWAHGRYYLLEDGYDSWIGDDKS